MPKPEVTEVRKKGDHYQVVGYDQGRRVSGEIHASQIDGKSESVVKQLLRRGVHNLAEYERSKPH